jgi:hypothetical protein
MASQAFPPTPNPGTSSGQYSLNSNRRSSLSIPAFLDTPNGMDMDHGMYMASPTGVMNLFSDNAVDVSSLFSSDFTM